MLGAISRFAAAVGFCLTLVACKSANLIELNRDFVRLSQQEVEAERLHEEGVLAFTDYETAIEGFQADFAENGEKAIESATQAESPQSKASFLNVAVRSFVKSGALGDFRIPDLAAQGIAACATEEMSAINALPTTCGYFHLAIPQAVNNETERIVAPLQRKAVRIRQNDELLTDDEGKQLEDAFNTFLDQIYALGEARPNIDWDNIDPIFETVFERQRLIFFCNAWSTWRSLSDVIETGPDWNREDAKARTGLRLDQSKDLVGVTHASADCAEETSLGS